MSTARAQYVSLKENWEFKQEDKGDEDFRKVAQFPTNVHLDLMHHGLIPDPFIGTNEKDVQWVAEKRWVYRTTFKTPDLGGTKTVELAFDGLDTFATVKLNGTIILETDNMFVPERVDVAGTLRGKDEENELVILFDSAYLRGWDIVENNPEHKWGEWNGDHSRLAVRKAQYHWGWDWGPCLNTCGPWRPVRLIWYDLRLVDPHVDLQEVDIGQKEGNATVSAHVVIRGKREKDFQVNFTLLTPEGPQFGEVGVMQRASVTVLASQDPDSNTTTVSTKFDRIIGAKVWWPARYGDQPLYTVRATLHDTDQSTHNGLDVGSIDACFTPFGIRQVKLVQQPLYNEPGTSFYFQVNGKDIFCGGSNWIPADSFIPRITKERYEDWVRLLVEGNQVMVRVWGGGIYEQEDFYNACDKAGILVWQDFMFGCGNYPATDAILKSIRREAEANVKRLRRHTSIVIWAGNNEDYQYAESEKLTYDYDDKDPDNWFKTDFPARYIYEKLLPDVCKEYAPGTFYHPGSPWGGGVDTHDPTVGDIHQWNVWHGTQEKYQNFDKLVGRFVSEFGMEAFPSCRTIDGYLPKGRDDPDRRPGSATVDHHNKADGHERRLALYLAENLDSSYVHSLEHFVYHTQLMQAECLGSAYRLWKRRWQGPSKQYCGGALVWQINDCWPVTSWAIVDYHLRPKLAYYAIKREMGNLTVGTVRRVRSEKQEKRRHTEHYIDTTTTIEAWACNLTLREIEVHVCVRAWDIETGDKILVTKMAEKNLVLQPNRSTEIAGVTRKIPTLLEDGDPSRTVVCVSLHRTGEYAPLITQHVNWPEPLKHCRLARSPKIRVLVKGGYDVVDMDDDSALGLTYYGWRSDDDAISIHVEAEVPVKGFSVVSEDDGDELCFDKNCIDLVPDQPETILAWMTKVKKGKKKPAARSLRFQFYGMEQGYEWRVLRLDGLKADVKVVDGEVIREADFTADDIKGAKSMLAGL